MKSFFFPMIRQKGMTIVELMVAVLIASLSIYAVYQVYEGTERAKRTVASVGDAQVSGLYAIHLIESTIRSAGVGMMRDSGQRLAGCIAGSMGGVTSPAGLTLRPLPVVIDGVRTPDDNFDDIFVFSGAPTLRAFPVQVAAVAGPVVTVAGTPLGFRSGDVLIEVTDSGCQAYIIQNAGADAQGRISADVAGQTTVTLDRAGPAVNSWLIDIGTPKRARFYVDPDTNTLLMEDWVLGAGGLWIINRRDPIVSGVMSFRAQYGIGPNTGDVGAGGRRTIGEVNEWRFADAPWTPAVFDTTPLDIDNTVRRIRAIRLSIIVRSDEQDINLAGGGAVQFVPFADCSGPAATTCSPVGPPLSFSAGWRYRMYETVIPLKNVILN
ncbi:MAG: PilW family protein [Proteobacteria bacterium]|nr:PilW family protein [Pseudomonadota bacterium]MCL2307481.1 PilW family protein [Pseudomonadota bacterium]